jgi:hypothetical protein
MKKQLMPSFKNGDFKKRFSEYNEHLEAERNKD